MKDEELKFVFECELLLAKTTPGPMDLHRIDNNDGTIAYQIQQNPSAPAAGEDGTCRVLTQFDDADNPNAKNDATFCQRSQEIVRRLIGLVHDRQSAREIIGYRLRWSSGITNETRWYAPGMSAPNAAGGTLFATKEEARKCLPTLNDRWQKEAKIVRVVVSTKRKVKS